jgi:dihydrofolate reductase
MEGGTTFHFVTDGIESALPQAREAAGSRDVSLGGGASTVQQYLALGLVDELIISLAPVFLERRDSALRQPGRQYPTTRADRGGRGAWCYTPPLRLCYLTRSRPDVVQEFNGTEQEL